MRSETDNMWVVGIGSSAGGLEALQAFVANLPKDIPAAFIVAQHLAPLAKSMMVELLAKHSVLPVSLATHKKPCKSDVSLLSRPILTSTSKMAK